jgi:Holliday junction DNA helicase RuvA
MNIFSTGRREQIIKAIISADTSFFKSVPRLGQKNAQKIIIELKNKLGGIGEIDLSGDDIPGQEEIAGALRGFGFTSKEVYDAIKHVKKADQEIAETIKLALRYLGK